MPKPSSKRQPQPEADGIAEFIAALQTSQLGSNYTPTDRYRDFNAVFFGSPAGKRVFAQIIAMLDGPVAIEADLEKPGLMAGRAWARRIGVKISEIASVPPPSDAPQKDNTKERV